MAAACCAWRYVALVNVGAYLPDEAEIAAACSTAPLVAV